MAPEMKYKKRKKKTEEKRKSTQQQEASVASLQQNCGGILIPLVVDH
jgi:hypothetical protein